MSRLVDLIKNRWRGKHNCEAKSFRENQEFENAFDHVDRGTRNVPWRRLLAVWGVTMTSTTSSN
jgi:hypothetical protein